MLNDHESITAPFACHNDMSNEHYYDPTTIPHSRTLRSPHPDSLVRMQCSTIAGWTHVPWACAWPGAMVL